MSWSLTAAVFRQLERHLKSHHLDWAGQPLVGRRPVWPPVGQEDLHLSEDAQEDWEDWGEESVPPEAARMAAETLRDRQQMGEDRDPAGPLRQTPPGQGRRPEEVPEAEMANFVRHLGWRGPPLGEGRENDIEF